MMNGPFIPIEELAKHFSVSVSTIRAWVRQEHIPKDTYIKVGNTYRFSIADVSAALTNNDGGKARKDNDAQVGGLAAVADVALVQGYTDDDDL
tara:strand:+ start:5023 stop:5301 length:279 start_codon:yes stop_codon:yes gene_type:complete